MPGKSNKLVFTRVHLAESEAVTITEPHQSPWRSHKTIRRRIADGTLPAFRIAGGRIRILASDVRPSNSEPVSCNESESPLGRNSLRERLNRCSTCSWASNSVTSSTQGRSAPRHKSSDGQVPA